MRKKGYSLIESIVSIAIILIMLLFLYNNHLIDMKINEQKRNIKECNTIISFIDKEIKYCINYDLLNQKFVSKPEWRFEKENIIELLTIKSLFEIEEGEGVILKNISQEDDSIEYKIIVDDIEINQIKYRWMDEIK